MGVFTDVLSHNVTGQREGAVSTKLPWPPARAQAQARAPLLGSDDRGVRDWLGEGCWILGLHALDGYRLGAPGWY